MKKVNISVPFDDDKLRAARFYAGKKDASLEGELEDYLQKLYEKYVPKDTREYIESNTAPVAKASARKPQPRPASPQPISPGTTSPGS